MLYVRDFYTGYAFSPQPLFERGKNKAKGSFKSYSSAGEATLLTDTSQGRKCKLNMVRFCTVIILLLSFPILLTKLIWSQGK